MIIVDKDIHKIDVTFSEDGWLRLTVFHRKTIESSEWTIKYTTISPDAQAILVDMILEKQRQTNTKGN